MICDPPPAEERKTHLMDDQPGNLQSREPLVVLTGPTAVGKTRLSIALSKEVRGSVISADSMQVYRHMDIGSAKIMPEEMNGIPHYLIDILDPEEEFNVVLFQQYARTAMEEIRREGRMPVIAGGTGFYIQALLREVDFGAETDELQRSSRRSELEAEAAAKGAAAMHRRLEELDPEAAREIHPNNVRRVIRAIEYFEETGSRISEHNVREREKESPYNYVYFVLDDERERLYAAIDARIDRMMEQGLVEEVRRLLMRGLNEESMSMKGLGYKELLPYFRGECDLEEAVRVIKRDTRHFAKRQLTWFRREQNVTWIRKQDFGYDEEAMLRFMLDTMKEKGLL